ncbi:MAG: hypothetical protein E7597_03205 [Ruminococcaceae bacterium]|nr:hypothetical protein [Oscillospiraceae bacterium]
MKKLLALVVVFAMLVTAASAATFVTANTQGISAPGAKAVASTTYTLSFEDNENGTGTLTVTLPANIQNGKIAIKTSADLSYVANSAQSPIDGTVNDTAVSTKGIVVSFAEARSYNENAVLLTAEYTIASGAQITADDIIVDSWKLGDGTSYVSTNADGNVNVIIKERPVVSVSDNLLLGKPYTVVTDATANKADGGNYITNGAIRGDADNAWNGDLAVTGVTVEWFGTSKTITYTFAFDTATNVDEIVFRNVRIASNRAFGTVVVNGSTIVMSSQASKTAVVGAPLYGVDSPIEQYFDISIPVVLTGITELTVALITDMYVCQYDEIEAYGENGTTSEEPSSDEPSSDEPSSDEPSSDEPSSDEPSSDEPSSDEPSSDEPSSDEPSSDEPSSDEPSSDEPSSDEPSSDEPSSDEPSSDEPSSDEPSSDEPSSNEPSSDESSEDSSVEDSEDASTDDASSDEDSSEDQSSDDEPSDEPADLLYGDVNADTSVNSLDAAQALKHDAKLITLEGVALTVGDVNGDGVVNSLDAAQILKFDAKLISLFPVEE